MHVMVQHVRGAPRQIQGCGAGHAHSGSACTGVRVLLSRCRCARLPGLSLSFYRRLPVTHRCRSRRKEALLSKRERGNLTEAQKCITSIEYFESHLSGNGLCSPSWKRRDSNWPSKWRSESRMVPALFSNRSIGRRPGFGTFRIAISIPMTISSRIFSGVGYKNSYIYIHIDMYLDMCVHVIIYMYMYI